MLHVCTSFASCRRRRRRRFHGRAGVVAKASLWRAAALLPSVDLLVFLAHTRTRTLLLLDGRGRALAIYLPVAKVSLARVYACTRITRRPLLFKHR